MKINDTIRAILFSITVVFGFFGTLLLVISQISSDVYLNEFCAITGGVMLIVAIIMAIVRLTCGLDHNGDEMGDNY